MGVSVLCACSCLGMDCLGGCWQVYTKIGFLPSLSSARSAGFDSSMRLAPSQGELFVGVNLIQLSKHGDGDALKKLAMSRGLLPQVLNEKGSCLEAEGAVSRNTAVRLVNGRFLHILEGKMNPTCTKKHFAGRLEANLKKANRSFTGTLGSSTYVAVSGNQIVLFVDEQHAVLGRMADLEKHLKTTVRGKKAVVTHSRLKGLYRRASRSDALAWSFSRIPKRLRDRARNTPDDAMSTVRHVIMTVAGARGADIVLRAALETREGATKLKALLQRRIRERVSGSLILRALGVAAMVDNALTLTTRGSVLEAKITLSSFQTGILARSAGKILSVLE